MLKEFLGSSTPPYAILSHTWEEEEVIFSDLQSLSDAKLKKGWRKVWNTCKQAKLDGLEWVWIDTCCIDKDSSAQLSEAINSMFRFYRDSFVCYVYLSDFEDGYYRSIHHAKELRHCRWFTRGWTLQELLAPSYMVFFDASWKDVGTKQELKHLISIITGIPSRVLDDGDLRGISTAAKMSWAAGRQSTREEDQAYSLMGLFGVNIPPLYGEGGVRAFMRLQEEIIKYSDDQSIFAWNSPCLDRRSCGSLERRGLLAISPSEFRHCGNVQNPEESNRQPKLPYSLTNRGLHIHLPLKPVSIVDAPGIPPENLYIARLESHVDANAYLGIYLQRLDGREYVRWKPDLTLVLENEPQDRFENSELYVKQILPSYHRFQDEAETELRSVTGCWKSWPESFRLVQSERLHLERQTIQNGTTCCQITDRLTQRSFDVHYGLITPDQFSVCIVPRLSSECSSSNRMMKEESPSHNAEEFISTRLRKFFSGWSVFCICIDVLPGSQGDVQDVANNQNRQSIAIGFLTRTRIMGSAAYTLITLADVAMFVTPEGNPSLCIT